MQNDRKLKYLTQRVKITEIRWQEKKILRVKFNKYLVFIVCVPDNFIWTQGLHLEPLHQAFSL
jgi:hypothetical protein